MRNRSTTLLAGALAALVTAAVYGGDLSDPEFRAEVAEKFPGVEKEDITPSSAAGIWQISQGGVIGYISADGRYLFDGDLIDLDTDVNLSERERRAWRLRKIERIGEDRMLVYAPRDPKFVLTVFTDVNCPYCRRLHAQIDELLAVGIRVRYLFYPLEGPDSEAFRKAQAVWCSHNRRKALTLAKQDKPVSGEPGCGSPVERHYRLAKEVLKLRGTPTLVTEDGRILRPGIPVSELIATVIAKGEE